MSTTITVQLDALDALAGELTALSGELADDADRCAAAGRALAAGLSRDEGLTTAWAAGRWTALARAVAEATHAVGAALADAVVSYRAADEARAQAIGHGRLEYVAVAW
jgi:uncharacterized protein YukE